MYFFWGVHAPKFTLSVLNFAGRPWGLVDFNQMEKVPNGVDIKNIVSVVDHHQLLGVCHMCILIYIYLGNVIRCS